MNHHQNLNQQIKQINSIEHKKISSMNIVDKPGKAVGSIKYRIIEREFDYGSQLIISIDSRTYA
ncbi:MAG: hypothetical protein MGG11_02685 [Trichodesmium sp. MAG_R03]|nr:hypothetical protein [Trichodesmium sp. MAG_R03]